MPKGVGRAVPLEQDADQQHLENKVQQKPEADFVPRRENDGLCASEAAVSGPASAKPAHADREPTQSPGTLQSRKRSGSGSWRSL
eukprot:2567614-Rhodomonas_salina.2